MKCPRCRRLIVIVDSHDHSTWHKDFRCINCGRYWPVKQPVAVVIPQEWKGTNKKYSVRPRREAK